MNPRTAPSIPDGFGVGLRTRYLSDLKRRATSNEGRLRYLTCAGSRTIKSHLQSATVGCRRCSAISNMSVRFRACSVSASNT
eukprot:81282-Alexandrium_andersonii.AAC.1